MQTEEQLELEDLQNRCAEVYLSWNKHLSKEEVYNDHLKSWSKSACIRFLKNEGKWEE